jgi:hypothetical protein
MVENHLDIGGAVTFWSLAAWTDRRRLADALTPLGLEAHVPEPRPAPAALKDALEHTFAGPRVLVRPLSGRDGFAVVREERGPAGNRYATDLVARVAGDPPELSFDPWDRRSDAVASAFHAQRGRVPAGQLAAALVAVVASLGGTRLRPNGAVYWVPGNRLDEWSRAARAVESAADGRPSAVYVLRHRLDADAVRAVRDAVVAEVLAEAERVRDEVAAGDLGGRALESRRRQASELRSKVLLYEELLSVGLGGLHRAVDAADQAAATAALLLGAEAAAGEPVAVAG